MKASNIKPITYMKTHAAELIRDVNETRSPIVITQNGEARAVVLDAASYDQMRDALILLKILSQSDAEYQKSNWKSQEEVEAELEKRFPG
jgi:prevent-host-death family protein